MIIKDTDLKDIQTSDNYIALGSFDGLHLGHLSLIHKVHEEAENNGGKSIVYTFKNHPRAVLNKENAPKLLMDNNEKAEILESYGIDMLYFQEFNNEFMKITPKEFIEFLINRFNAKFEFYTGETVSAENVRILLDVVKNNLNSVEYVSNGTTEEDNTETTQPEDVKEDIKILKEYYDAL